MRWFRRFRAPEFEHARFGRVRAAARPASGPWLWETLNLIETPRGTVDVTFDAGEGGPTQAHEDAWDWILANLDAVTAAAAPPIASELREWLEQPFPADPWDELEWEGAHLPASPRPGDTFEIRYACKSWPDAMITVYFDQGRPTLVQVDD